MSQRFRARFAAWLILLLAATTQANADPPAQPNATPPVDSIDRQPYRIELHLAVDPSARIDRARLAELITRWQALVRRFVGPPWSISVAGRPSPLAGGDLESLDADSLVKFDPAFDKIWLVRISASRSAPGIVFAGREYDTATRRLGAIQEHSAVVLADAPRAMLRFALELFSPTALITGQEGGRALLLVRAAAVEPSSELGRVVARGTVFIPLRLVTRTDNTVLIRRILFSYLQVEEMTGPTARCTIVSALRDPLTQRVSRPNSLAAIGVKPGTSPIRFRFLTRPDQAPAAGYTVTARTLPDGVPRELGMTDRAGRIALKPGFAPSLVILRLLAANAEPVAEFPVMPGEGGEEREVPIDPRPLSVSYQVRLDALRDEVIDLVALRSRIEKRLEARLQGEDLAAIEQGLKEYALLPRKEIFSERLTGLKDQAAKEHAATKSAVLTRNLQAKFNELQALIDRYLTDDAFASYSEALDRKRAEKSEPGKPQAKSRKAPAPAEEPAAPVKPDVRPGLPKADAQPF